jgi:phosphoribosylformylglycinamidine synthase
VVEVVRGLVADGILAGVHDVSEGGLGVALTEMAFAGDVGFRVTGIDGHAALFSESPSRAVVCVAPEQASEVLRRAEQAGVPATLLGGCGGDRLVADGLFDLSLTDARSRWQAAIPEAVAP